MEWHESRLFNSWEDFRDGFYYPEIVGRAWNGSPNKTLRRGDQTKEQEVHDLWRKHMGFDAPWTDIMVLYDHGKCIGLGEIKRGQEGWSRPNKRAAENVAQRLNVPLVLMRFLDANGPIVVDIFR